MQAVFAVIRKFAAGRISRRTFRQNAPYSANRQKAKIQQEKEKKVVLKPFDQELPESDASDEGMFPQRISLAMSYVPNQPFANLNDEPAALARGTLFKSLDFPFVGAKRK